MQSTKIDALTGGESVQKAKSAGLPQKSPAALGSVSKLAVGFGSS
jgi:hypothetical protein